VHDFSLAAPRGGDAHFDEDVSLSRAFYLKIFFPGPHGKREKKKTPGNRRKSASEPVLQKHWRKVVRAKSQKKLEAIT